MDYKQAITQLVEKTVTNAVATILKNFTFSEVVKTLKTDLDNLGVKLIETVCRAVDDVYEQDRPKGITIKNKAKQRTMMTTFGMVTLNRRLYRDVNTEKCFFAIDELMQLPKYSRIETQLKADLIKRATTGSYRSATDIIGGKLSHQSVYNLVKEHKPSNVIVSKEKATVVKVYIEADEDHIHLQNGKCAEVKLVYVHEGRQTEGGRTQLINPKYFVSLSQKADDIWLRASNYVYSRFNTKNAEVHISGDGAAWIKVGLEYLPRAKYHLDKFHLIKSVTSVAGGNLATRNEILQAVKDKDYATIEYIYNNIMMSQTRRADRKRTFESLRYIDNNFEEISLSADNLCSAEGHISHVLSSRMSSRPMGWSIAGAERIANLRAYLYNGGDFMDLVKQGKEKSNTINSKRTKNMVKGRKSKSHSALHTASFTGTLSGTTSWLRSISKRLKNSNFDLTKKF